MSPTLPYSVDHSCLTLRTTEVPSARSEVSSIFTGLEKVSGSPAIPKFTESSILSGAQIRSALLEDVISIFARSTVRHTIVVPEYMTTFAPSSIFSSATFSVAVFSLSNTPSMSISSIPSRTSTVRKSRIFGSVTLHEDTRGRVMSDDPVSEIPDQESSLDMSDPLLSHTV